MTPQDPRETMREEYHRIFAELFRSSQEDLFENIWEWISEKSLDRQALVTWVEVEKQEQNNKMNEETTNAIEQYAVQHIEDKDFNRQWFIAHAKKALALNLRDT
jgi:glutamate synthase domain-containing protein 1